MLMTPFSINGLTLKNRWVMLAMHTGFFMENQVTEREIAFYEQRAKGGAAAITLVMGVNPEGSLKGMLDGATMTDWLGFKTLVDRIHLYDCKVFVQLFHCGANESEANHQGHRCVAPSAVASPIFKNMPVAMTKADLEETKQDFAKVAKKCQEVGVDGIEISCSAGYLLSAFLSPLTNLRTDEYGGNFENRISYPLEVMNQVRQMVGTGYPVLVKLSGAQMVQGGYSLEEMQAFAKTIEEKALADALVVTGGWHESPVEQISYHVPKGGFASLIDAIKTSVSLPVVGCNRIADGETAERLLQRGICDLVGSARGFLCDPSFVERIAEEKPYNICQGCNKCIQAVLEGKEIFCAYQPEVGKEFFEGKRRKIATRKKVIVLGGGPGGMMAAKKSAERGFKTILCTDEKELGGQLHLAALPSGKEDMRKYILYMEYELERLGVEIRYETTMDVEEIIKEEPYFVAIAIGSQPVVPKIKGVEGEEVYLARDVFLGDAQLFAHLKKGKTVILGGGSLGLEIGEFLWEKCHASAEEIGFMEKVKREKGFSLGGEPSLAVLEKCSVLGVELGPMKRPLLNQLKGMGIAMTTCFETTEICDGYLIGEKDGKEEKILADHVIIAMGSAPRNTDFISRLEDERISFSILGDAARVGDAKMALDDAYEIFSRLYLA